MSGADLRTVTELLRDRTLAMVLRCAHLDPDYKLAEVKRMVIAYRCKTTVTKLTPRVERQKQELSLIQ